MGCDYKMIQLHQRVSWISLSPSPKWRVDYTVQWLHTKGNVLLILLLTYPGLKINLIDYRDFKAKLPVYVQIFDVQIFEGRIFHESDACGFVT